MMLHGSIDAVVLLCCVLCFLQILHCTLLMTSVVILGPGLIMMHINTFVLLCCVLCADLALYPAEKWKDQGWDFIDSLDAKREWGGFSYMDMPDPIKGQEVCGFAARSESWWQEGVPCLLAAGHGVGTIDSWIPKRNWEGSSRNRRCVALTAC